MQREEDLSEAASRLALERTAAGDRRAFGRVVSAHQRAVHRFLTHLLGDPALAEDVLQEAFVAALEGAASFRGEGSVRSWLFTIARREMLMMRRKRTPEPVGPVQLEALALAAGWGEDRPADDLARRVEDRDALSRALATLDEDERAVLLLRDVEGLSGEEAAAALELSLPALKSRLHRARLRLASALASGGSHDRT